jgi:hypothetical protein
VTNVKGQRGKFLNNNLDALIDSFGSRLCMSERTKQQKENGDDERGGVKSNNVSPSKMMEEAKTGSMVEGMNLSNSQINKSSILVQFKPIGFMPEID